MSKHPVVALVGLTDAEVEASRAKHGLNLMTPPPREPWWEQYLGNFEDPVVRILMVAAALAIVVGLFDGHYVEGIGIIIAILLATGMAFINEYRANNAFDLLNQANDDVPIKVLRGGSYRNVAKKDIVVGDLVSIEDGEEPPADGDVLEAVNCQVDEASLTGESVPVSKRPREGDEDAGDGAYAPWQILRGTRVVDGHALFRVTAVGDHTTIGQAAREAAGDEEEQTPLNKQLEKLSKMIGVVGFGIAAMTFGALVFEAGISGGLEMTPGQWMFFGVLAVATLTLLAKVWIPIVGDAFEIAGREFEPPAIVEEEGIQSWMRLARYAGIITLAGAVTLMIFAGLPFNPFHWMPFTAIQTLLGFFMIATTLIVVAVPEGLAMSVTLSLAYSMRKMIATNNLVRKMHATETIGAATVICSDKTGTLTQNDMRVREAHFPALNGGLTSGVQGSAAIIVEAVAGNTTAHLSVEGTKDVVLGNKTEGALLLWLKAAGIDYNPLRQGFGGTFQVTFNTLRKWMGTLGQPEENGPKRFHMKGAPEIVLAKCSTILTQKGPEPIDGFRQQIEEGLLQAQKRGMRTLALAYRDDPGAEDTLEHLAEGMTFLGFFVLEDPLRAEVPEAIRTCLGAGVDVKMITGDTSETAKEIGRQIGLWTDHEAEFAHMTGVEFEALPDEEAFKRAKGIKILSRARPLDKLRLVTLLQQQNEVVAVTGDGINDAAALNRAHVGLAMGSGKDVAKEASDIVLLDDSFGSVVNAIRWGRSLYENIQRFILFQLTINVAALGIALLGPFIGVQMPLTVTQMLWVNLIMDTFAALALATEPPKGEVLKRKPRHPDAFIVTTEMARQIFGMAGVFLAILVGILVIMQWNGEVSPWELSVFFTIFVLLQFWNLFNARCLGLKQSAFDGLAENPSFLLIAGLILFGQIGIVQFGGSVFRTVPLGILEWIGILLLTSPVLIFGEARRRAQMAKP